MAAIEHFLGVIYIHELKGAHWVRLYANNSALRNRRETAHLLIDKMNFQTARVCPVKYLVKIVLTLPCCCKMLLTHKLPNPLIAIYNINTSHRMWLNILHRLNITSLCHNAVHLLHIMRNKLLKIGWINVQ